MFFKISNKCIEWTFSERSGDITLMEESLCGRKFCGSAEPQNFCICGNKLLRFVENESFLRKKLLRFVS